MPARAAGASPARAWGGGGRGGGGGGGDLPTAGRRGAIMGVFYDAPSGRAAPPPAAAQAAPGPSSPIPAARALR